VNERILKASLARVKPIAPDRALSRARTVPPMTLDDVATRLAPVIELDRGAFGRFAREDRHGGWDHGAGTFPKGSIWRVEGQVLYALVRALRPRYVADLGTHAGASATHLVAAVEANRFGRLVSVDRGFGDLLLEAGSTLLRESLVDRIVLGSHDRHLVRKARKRGWTTDAVVPRVKGARHCGGVLTGYLGPRRVIRIPGDVPLPYPGHLIPESLRRRCRVVIADAIAWLRTARGLDFVFEDLDHDRAGTARVARLVRRALNPGGLLVCHDALHPRCGKDVRGGLADAGLQPVCCVLAGRSDCGLAVWRKPAKRRGRTYDGTGSSTSCSTSNTKQNRKEGHVHGNT
jgi:predicted O-methyltransferase YrrM